MKELEAIRGHWWRADAPLNRAFGVVDLDADGWRLEVGGILGDGTGRSWWDADDDDEAVQCCLHGSTTDGRDVTLLRCIRTSANDTMPTASPIEQWIVNGIVLDGHISGEDERFSAVRVSVRPAEEWLGHRNVTREWREDRTITLSSVPLQHGPVRISDHDTITIHVAHGADFAENRLTSEAIFEVRSTSTFTMREAEKLYVDPLVEMMSFVTNGYVEVRSVRFEPPDHDVHALRPELRRRWRTMKSAEPTVQHFDMLLPDMMLGRSPEQFTADWLRLQRTYGYTMTMLVVPERAQFMHADTHLHVTWLAIEHFQSRRFGSSVTKEERDQRNQRVLDSAPDDLREWLRSVLPRSRNRGLPSRLMDVINHAGNTGTVISESVPNLVRRACAARNRVAHPNPRGADGWEYYVLYKALRWILRHCLLLELGYSQEEASERVRRCMAFDRESRTIRRLGRLQPDR